VRTANHRYKSYNIAKRSGGLRLIQHPARELKFLQRWVVSKIFIHAKVHQTATAYKTGASARRNAEIHARARFFLKLDFEDFFSCILAADVVSLLQKLSLEPGVTILEEDIGLVSQIVTRYGRLTIGAPSSPIVSNAVMYDFDGEMFQLATRFGCTYSRYVDDIVFSTLNSNTLEKVLPEVRDRLRDRISPRLRINEKKVAFTSKKRRVRVTGLVITSDDRISIGRSTKRKIKALVHQFVIEKLSDDTKSYLSGYLAYLKGADPSFFVLLENKYGVDTIRSILRAPQIRRKRIFDPEEALLYLLMLQQKYGVHQNNDV
jgi:RNA-directed DNA polymerase